MLFHSTINGLECGGQLVDDAKLFRMVKSRIDYEELQKNLKPEFGVLFGGTRLNRIPDAGWWQ